MQKIRVIVASEHKVAHSGVAAILSSADKLEVIGREGTYVLKEAFELQPDLIVYELCSKIDEDFEILSNLRQLCKWTKIIIYSTRSLTNNSLKIFSGICVGYLKGPLMPGLLLKAVDLACYSGHSFFLLDSSELESSEEDNNHYSSMKKFPGIN